MSIDRSMRASDRDRDKAAEILRDARAAGRLNDLTADLPASPPGESPSEIMAMRNAAHFINKGYTAWRSSSQMLR
jgi:hypothetical protein